MVQWTLRHRVFSYDAFVKITILVITAQRVFRPHFDIYRNQPVQGRNMLLR